MPNYEGFPDPTADLAVGRTMRRRRLKGARVSGAQTLSAVPTVPQGTYAGRHLRRQDRETVPLVYVCSRFAGRNESEVREHIRRARRYSRFVFTRQAVPLTPHLLYPQFLRDGVPVERELGTRSALKLLRVCDELWAFVPDGISAGMRREVVEALARGIPVRFFDDDFQEVRVDERNL